MIAKDVSFVNCCAPFTSMSSDRIYVNEMQSRKHRCLDLSPVDFNTLPLVAIDVASDFDLIGNKFV